MPIYEYQCGACGRRHEALQGVREPPLRECPHCGKPELVKLISAAGFRLAGSGWYETDFKTGDKRNLAASPDSPDSKSESKSQSKGESKDAGGKSSAKGGGDKPSAAGQSSSGPSSSGKASSSKSSPGHSSSDKPSSSGGA